MNSETMNAVIGRIQSIETEVEALRSTIAAEALATSQRQYLARCFDLLHMELAALRTYLKELR